MRSYRGVQGHALCTVLYYVIAHLRYSLNYRRQGCGFAVVKSRLLSKKYYCQDLVHKQHQSLHRIPSVSSCTVPYAQTPIHYINKGNVEERSLRTHTEYTLLSSRPIDLLMRFVSTSRVRSFNDDLLLAAFRNVV